MGASIVGCINAIAIRSDLASSIEEEIGISVERTVAVFCINTVVGGIFPVLMPDARFCASINVEVLHFVEGCIQNIELGELYAASVAALQTSNRLKTSSCSSVMTYGVTIMCSSMPFCLV